MRISFLERSPVPCLPPGGVKVFWDSLSQAFQSCPCFYDKQVVRPLWKPTILFHNYSTQTSNYRASILSKPTIWNTELIKTKEWGPSNSLCPSPLLFAMFSLATTQQEAWSLSLRKAGVVEEPFPLPGTLTALNKTPSPLSTHVPSSINNGADSEPES